MTEIDEASLPSRRRRALTSPSRWSKPTSPLFNFFLGVNPGENSGFIPQIPREIRAPVCEGIVKSLSVHSGVILSARLGRGIDV